MEKEQCLKKLSEKKDLAIKRAKRKNPRKEGTVKMHDITQPITLEDLTNPNKK